MTVFVLGTNKQPLAPCSFARAQQLLHSGKAAVFRRYPFTIILKRVVENPTIPSLRLKVDPGSKTTGFALVNEDKAVVIWAAELTHRGQQIKDALESRRAIRRNRRSRKTRYRQPRFLNRTRSPGWLPPSLQSRIVNILTWVRRIQRVCPLSALSQELVRFDTQLMQNAEVSGVEYQRGELVGVEVREYLLEKWGRTCAYCGKKDIPLEVEHITPKSRGGSNRVSNLCISCRSCNQQKNNQTAAEFGHSHIQAKAKQPLKDATAVNSTRWALYQQLQQTGLTVEVGTGGRTKYNRERLGLPKAHWIDAALVGASTPDILMIGDICPLLIRAMGHGNRQMCKTDKYGFPMQHRTRQKRHFGFQTGDLVRAVVPTGKYVGTWVSRVVVRARPSFTLRIAGKPADVHQKYCMRLFAADGYSYVV